MTYDICVIGGGIGGYTSAINGAKLGVRVILVEEKELGGTCLNRGCIPTKNFHHLAHFLEKSQKINGNGITFEKISFNWQSAKSKKNKIVEKLTEGLRLLLKGNKVEFVNGRATIISQNKIVVRTNGGELREIESKNIIVATGSNPILPDALSYDGKNILSPEDFLNIEELPKTLIIVGGGIIGIEFASIFSTLGVEITLLELLPEILTPIDSDATKTLIRHLKRKKIKIYTNCKVDNFTVNSNIVTAHTSLGDFTAEKAVLSLGRIANLNTSGLDKIFSNISSININNKMQTEYSNIFIIGDATNKNFLAHTAMHEGIVASSTAMGLNKEINYNNIPITIFSLPEIAQIGKTEDFLLKENVPFKVGRFPYSALGKAHATMDEEGFAKIISHNKTGEILGCIIIGAEATNLIGEMIPILGLKLKTSDITELIHPHPTLTELISEAILDIDGNSIHKI